VTELKNLETARSAPCTALGNHWEWTDTL